MKKKVFFSKISIQISCSRAIFSVQQIRVEKSEGYDIYPSVKRTGEAVKFLYGIDSWDRKSHCPKHIFFW